MSTRGWTLFAVLGLVWGIPYLLIRVAVGDVDPLVVAFGRTVIGAGLLLPLALRRRALRPALRTWPWLLAFAGAEIVGPWLLLGHAETQLTSATTGLLVAITPLLAIVIAAGVGIERLRRERAWGLIIGLAGVLALVGWDIDISNLPAVGAVVLAALGYAIGPMIISRKLAGVPPIGVIAAALIIASLVYAPGAAIVWPDAWTVESGVSIVLLGVICTGLAFVLFFSLIAETGPARATVITYINPAVAIALGAAILHEPISPGMLLGFPLVIAGSVLATRGGTRENRAPSVNAPALPQTEVVR